MRTTRANWRRRSPPSGGCSPGGASRRCSSPTSTPAREIFTWSSPSELIAGLVTVPCRIVERGRLADEVAAMPTDVVISFGAGNIDACCGALAERLRAKS